MSSHVFPRTSVPLQKAVFPPWNHKPASVALRCELHDFTKSHNTPPAWESYPSCELVARSSQTYDPLAENTYLAPILGNTSFIKANSMQRRFMFLFWLKEESLNNHRFFPPPECLIFLIFSQIGLFFDSVSCPLQKPPQTYRCHQNYSCFVSFFALLILMQIHLFSITFITFLNQTTYFMKRVRMSRQR